MKLLSQSPWLSVGTLSLVSIALWEAAKGIIVDRIFQNFVLLLISLGAENLAQLSLALALLLLSLLLFSIWLYFERRSAISEAVRFKAELLRREPHYLDQKEYSEAFNK